MRPTGRTLYVGTALCAGAVMIVYFTAFTLVWKIGAALFSGILILDYFYGRKVPDILVTRTVKRNLPVGAWAKVILCFENRSTTDLMITAHDFYPENARVDSLPFDFILPAHRKLKKTYRFLPQSRGDFLFSGIDIAHKSPFGFWRKKTFFELEETIKVFPNFREIKKYTLLATDNRLSQIGIKRKQRRGEGNDFHQLREYRSGDSLRKISWNATSKYLKLISKEYQDERDQQILFMIDCSRRMRHKENNRSHMDQVLNAMLLLTYVALKQEDAVGFFTFGGPTKWFPPKKNTGTIRHILNQTYEIKPTIDAADYLMAAQKVLSLQKRRSLIIMLTNTSNEDTSDLLKSVMLLQKKHLVVLADLREDVLDATQMESINDLDAALKFLSVNNYLTAREYQHRKMKYNGVFTLNLLAGQLPAALVNQYLMIKASGKL